MNKNLQEICKLIRYDILTATTAAGSGHPTSSLSTVELMATLFFAGHLKFDLKDPKYVYNDRVIFSKGHAVPLLYALYHVAGIISYEELLTLRTFNSALEGHPTPRFPYIDVATGSLGQGLSVGVGMALGLKLKAQSSKFKVKEEPKIWVLLGDSEMAEGQVWEAIQLASYYKLNNLVGILDVNRLGQRGETMLGWSVAAYEKRISSFGWKTVVVNDGHNLDKIQNAFNQITNHQSPTTNHQPLTTNHQSPIMIIAKTIKGKGVSFLENKDGWHGKPVPKDKLEETLKELGKIDLNVRGKVESPKLPIANYKCQIKSKIQNSNSKNAFISHYTLYDKISTREAYGDALVQLGKENEDVVVLDAETSNSTYAEKFKKVFPERFFEMFIAEQNMVSVALGFSKLGFIPFVSSFSAFLTRSFDQIRMAQYSDPNLKIVGSHAGVSIGEDGPSQMALEDLATTRSILNSTVLYPSDAVSTVKLTHLMNKTKGLIFLRTTREKTPVIYSDKQKFFIGGSKIHKPPTTNHQPPSALIIAAGITLHEALKAQKKLTEENIQTIVIDCYSVKPIDQKTINHLAKNCPNIIVVEDHYPYGGLGEAILSALTTNRQPLTFIHLCVRKTPRSGKPEKLLRYEKIDAEAIIKAVKSII